jgi:hypothetical protein
MSDFPFPMFGGGDPEEIQRQLAGFMEQAQQQQKVAFADQAINLAVGMTVAAIGRLELSGDPDQQAIRCETRSGCCSPRRSRWSAKLARAWLSYSLIRQLVSTPAVFL